jgi:hypothetical protein
MNSFGIIIHASRAIRLSHFIWAALLLSLLILHPAWLHAQSMQDSTGHIPAVRTQITSPSSAATWWQRVGEQHLLDFSEGENKIVVDPIVQVMAGTVQSDAANTTNRTFWDNIRGARFQAEIDGQFHIGGELLERQGVADPLLGLWAVQNRIPGWGRSKLGRDNAWNTTEQAYYDVSRARGWTGWTNGVWSADGGIDAMHFGAGRASAVLSKTAAPAPYARMGFQRNDHRTELAISQWISDERGPLGETAESLLRRAHMSSLTHAWNINEHWKAQGVYQFIRSKSPSVAASGWEELGYTAGQEYRVNRQVLGGETQFHFNLLQAGHGVFFVQQSWGVNRFSKRILGTENNFRKIHGLTSLAGFQFKSPRITMLIEAYRQSESMCTSCFEYQRITEDIGVAIGGPENSNLAHGGMSVHGIWNESLRVEVNTRLSNRWAIGITGEQNDASQWAQIQTSYGIQAIWPMELYCNVGKLYTRGALQNGYSWISFGIQAGIQHWK